MRAPIKQKTQVFNKPIGVTSIRTGEPEMWEQISASAERRYREAYKYNADRAKQQGVEAAAAVPTADLFAIDPVTREPTALKPPKSFGLIGRQAYENLINRRFEESIQGELERKASEYAQKFPSSQAFTEQFSKHIENMVAPSIDDAGETSAYGRVIKELGEEYLASTTAAMVKKEIEIANARLRRHNQLERFNNLKKAFVFSAAGDSQSASDLLQGEVERLEEEFIAGQVSWDEYKNLLEEIDGLKSMGSTNTLSTYYLENDEKQALVRLAIQDPSYRNELPESVQEDIDEALITSSPSELINALKGVATSSEDYFNDRIKHATNNLVSEINPLTTIKEINAKVVSLDPDVANKVKRNLVHEAIILRIHANVSEVGDITDFTNELSDASFSSTFQLLGVLGPAYVNELRKMSFEDRQSISNGVFQRHKIMNAADNDEQKRLKELFDKSLRSILTDQNLSIGQILEQSNDLISTVGASKFENKSSFIKDIQSQSAISIRNRARLIQLPPNELEHIRNLIQSGATTYTPNNDSPTNTEDSELYFQAMFYANNNAPAATSGEFDRKIEATKGDIDKAEKLKNVQYMREAIQGQFATPEIITEYDAEIFKGRIPPLTEILENQFFQETIKQGYVLPTFTKSLYASFVGGNSQVAAQALLTFKKFKLADAKFDNGKSYQYDLMKKHLTPEQYGMFNTALSAVERFGKDPSEFAFRQSSYDGDVVADLRKDFDRLITKDAALSTLFDDFNMSQEFKRELAAALVVEKIMGRTFTSKDEIEDFVDEYSSQMTEDEFVVTPTIDGKSNYSRYNWTDVEGMQAMREDVISQIADDPKYQNFFTGGTVLDSAIETLMQGLPARDAIRKLYEQDDTIKALQSDRLKTIRMIKTLGIDIYYQPIIESFENGVAQYRAGFMTEDKEFIPFDINNNSVNTSPPVEAESRGSELRAAMYQRGKLLSVVGNNYNKITNPNARLNLVRLDVRIQMLRGREMTIDEFKDNAMLYQMLSEATQGTAKTVDEIIEEQRQALGLD
tara:strand:+ start:1227 stop:4301 length:3075 start_codon:yes stop_codon:yes gene_type:complete